MGVRMSTRSNKHKPHASATSQPQQGPSRPNSGGHPTPPAPSIVMTYFEMVDRDCDGLINDEEMHRALSKHETLSKFSLENVKRLFSIFATNNASTIGIPEFTSLFYSLQRLGDIFHKSDRDRSHTIDAIELRDALQSLQISVPPSVLDQLISKFGENGGRNMAIEYDAFLVCCLKVERLTDKFKEKDAEQTGSATFTHEEFLLSVLPFLDA